MKNYCVYLIPMFDEQGELIATNSHVNYVSPRPLVIPPSIPEKSWSFLLTEDVTFRILKRYAEMWSSGEDDVFMWDWFNKLFASYKERLAAGLDLDFETYPMTGFAQ